MIFCGSGSTAAINKLVGILNIRIPADLDLRFDLRSHIPEKERPVVFVGPFEHHSNELPWRESLATVVTIPEDADGHIDVDALRAALAQYAQRPLKIGSFSAASNVTGIMTDTGAISTVLHEHGALAFWDYAAAGPYVDIDMNPPDELAYADAVFLSPHKFIGGPGTPACSWCAPRSSTTASRRWWAAELWPTSIRRTTCICRTSNTGKRREHLPSWNPSAPGWSSTSSSPSAST